MALAKAAGTSPAFEDEGAIAEAQASVTEVAPPEVKVAGVLAVAKAAATSVATGGTYGDVYKNFENVIQDLEFGTVARLVGSNGGITAKLNSKKLKLGKTIKATLVSFNDTYQISPGKDTDEAKKFVKYSSDGKHIDGTGEDVLAYIAKLRESGGYPEASLKKYTSLVVILDEVVDADGDKSLVGEMVEVSLSPTAGVAFKGLRQQRSVKVARKLATVEGIDQLVIRADVRQNGSNEYTALDVKDK